MARSTRERTAKPTPAEVGTSRVYGCSIELTPTGDELTVVREFTINRTSDPPLFRIEHVAREGESDAFWLRATCRMLDRERGVATGSCKYGDQDATEHNGVFLARIFGDLLVAQVLTDTAMYDRPRPMVLGPSRDAVVRRFRRELKQYRRLGDPTPPSPASPE